MFRLASLVWLPHGSLGIARGGKAGSGRICLETGPERSRENLTVEVCLVGWMVITIFQKQTMGVVIRPENKTR